MRGQPEHLGPHMHPVPRGHHVAVDIRGEVADAVNQAILGATGQAAGEMGSVAAGLEAQFDPGALRMQRYPGRVVADERVDVGTRGGDALRRPFGVQARRHVYRAP